MMLYEEEDFRRCRRCKRKRMDDEPPEVQQYKTCAKCRIIERNKKKLRKPLAEETMRYGIRQFHEQNQNANFIHDDVFTNDQLLSDFHASRDAGLIDPSKQLFNNANFSVYSQNTAAPAPPSAYGMPGGAASPSYGYGYGQPGHLLYPYNGVGSVSDIAAAAAAAAGSTGLPVYNQLPHLGNMSPYPPTAVQPMNGRPQPTTSASAAAIAAAAINRTDLLLGQPQPFRQQQQQYRQFQQKQDDRSRVIASTSCELCSLPIDADDSVSAIYRLCGGCYSDPYSRPGVYSDFNDFLLAVANDRKDSSAAYISELVPYLVESLNANRQITSELQFRKVMLDSFKLIYLDPLFALLSPAKLSQSFNNVSEVNNTIPVVSKVSHQNHYTLTPPIKLVYTSSSETESITVDLIFVAETNLVIIKKVTKKAAFEYSTSFFSDVDSKMRAKGLTFQDDPVKVYNELGLSIGLEKFVNDFSHVEKSVGLLHQQESAASSADHLAGHDTFHDATMEGPGHDGEVGEEREDDAESEEVEDKNDTPDVDELEFTAQDPNGVDPAFS